MRLLNIFLTIFLTITIFSNAYTTEFTDEQFKGFLASSHNLREQLQKHDDNNIMQSITLKAKSFAKEHSNDFIKITLGCFLTIIQQMILGNGPTDTDLPEFERTLNYYDSNNTCFKARFITAIATIPFVCLLSNWDNKFDAEEGIRNLTNAPQMIQSPKRQENSILDKINVIFKTRIFGALGLLWIIYVYLNCNCSLY